MGVKNMVITTDDVMEFYLENTKLIFNYNESIFLYDFNKDFGKGKIERIILNENLEVWIMDYSFNSDVTMIYDLPENCFEIAICTAGKMEHYEKNINQALTFSEGNIAVFAKKNAAGYAKYLKNTNYKGLSIITSKDYMINKLNKFSSKEQDVWMNVPNEQLDKFYMGLPANIREIKIVEEIINCTFKKAVKLMYIEAKANELLAIKFDEIKSSKKIEEKIFLSKYEVECILKAREILVKDMVNPPSIVELSKAVGINSTKLKKGFKFIFNNTIFGVLRDRRLEYSKKLLFENDKTIAEIANEVGYSNPSKFAKAFKNKYGLNPKNVKGRG